MLTIPQIVSLRVKIGDAVGIALAEEYSNGVRIVLERRYRDLSDVDVEVAANNFQETTLLVVHDYGALFEHESGQVSQS